MSTQKKGTNKTQSKQKEEYNKDQNRSKQNRKIEKVNETKSWLFERVRKIDKSLVRLIKQRTQINKIRNERREITIDTIEIQGLLTNTMNCYMPRNLTIQKKWVNFQKHRTFQG